MAKWYRISLSLAAKCRLGFAAAVLLIIGAALFVPYRWMDKLVEQGKLEQAQAEVQHVLANHFQPLKADSTVTAKVPPLLLSDREDKSIMPGRWLQVNRPARSGRDLEGPYVVLPTGQSNLSEWTLERLRQDRPLTQWIRILPETARLVLAEKEQATSQETAPAPGTDAGQVAPPAETAGPLETPPPAEPLRLPGNVFERRGIRKFLQHSQEQEIFELQTLEQAAVREGQDVQEKEGLWQTVASWLPKGQAAFFLRAVRADASCLAGGCHTSTGQEAADTSKPQTGRPIFTEGEFVGVISVTLPPGQTGTTLLFNRIFIVTAGLLASIIAIVTFYLITQRFILQPVRRLREAADRVTVSAGQANESSQTGKAVAGSVESWQEAMTITDKIKTGDEFERMASAFHEMLGRLKIAHDRLRETNRALDMQLGELQARNLALFESNKLKNEFLANVSHELRTPLNAILGFAQVIQDKAGENADEKTVRYAGNILVSGKRLLAIITDLLDLAKMEAGKVQVHWEQCRLDEILEVLMNFTRPLAERKELLMNRYIASAIGTIETDPGKLQQILFNLLSNAIEFTPEGGRVDITARKMDEDYLKIEISDTGPGIAEEDREKVFEKFRQVDSSVTREHSGTGLGLAIVKELVEILGGTVRVGGQVGKGTIITVILPHQRLGQRDDSAAPDVPAAAGKDLRAG
ncbi:MAG: HAMP domain-containing histidine kinase [Sedimentisphaerales bacterium]|nr:HAMP domain-containing histidine kinase [Sedimentisphaerales bacterium]